MNTRTDERTLYEAMGDIAYNCRYYLLQGRLFGKLAGAFQLVTFVSGSAAFAGFLGSNPKLAGMAALVTAAVTGLDFIISPARKAYTCNELHRRYRELERQAPKLSLKALDERLCELKTFEAPAIESLRVPAYNDACEERSRPEAKLPVGRWQRFVAAIA